MTDIPLANAQIIWRLDGEKGSTLRVVGGRVKDDDRYFASWGACDADFNEASESDKLHMLLAQYVDFTLNEGIAPEAVHGAFMVIPEYRKAMAEAAVIESPIEED